MALLNTWWQRISCGDKDQNVVKPSALHGELTPWMRWVRVLAPLHRWIQWIVAAFLVYWLVHDVAWHEVSAYLRDLQIGWVMMAALVLWLSHAVSALRLRYYLRWRLLIDHSMIRTMVLYHKGMVFNQLLPLSVGGDAYIALWLSRMDHRVSFWEATQCLLAARASGLCALLSWMLLCAAMSPSLSMVASPYWQPLLSGWMWPSIIIGLLAAVWVLYCWGVRICCGETWSSLCGAFGYSFVVQGCFLCAGLCLWVAMNQPFALWDHAHDSQHVIRLIHGMVVWMGSSIVSLLPVSFGGIGLREAACMMAAHKGLVNEVVSVSMAMMVDGLQCAIAIMSACLWCVPLRQKQKPTISDV